MDEEIIEVARTVRSYLPKLVGAEAETYDRDISGLLAESREGRDVADALSALLSRSPAVHAWAAQLLEDDQHRPPELQGRLDRGYEPLPGSSDPVAAQRYGCPFEDYVWFRISVTAPIPDCPTHACQLIPV